MNQMKWFIWSVEHSAWCSRKLAATPILAQMRVNLSLGKPATL